MQCPICWANMVGFIGSDCRCGPRDDPEPPENGVTVDGVLVTHNNEIVTHTE